MDDGSRLPWLITILLLFAAMFFAVSETAFAASSKSRLKAMSETGNKKADAALEILDNFDRMITTLLICTNIVHLSIASIVTVEVTKRMGVSAVAAGTIITTLVVFFAGEMLPKSIAKKFAEPLALSCAGPLKFFMAVFYPLSSALGALGNGVSRLVKGEPELSVTEDELYDIIEDMTEDGTLDEERGDLISSALQFGDLTVESVLTPRVDMVAVNADYSIERILSIIKSCTHSRLPVYKDSRDKIIGILQIRKFIKAYLKEGTEIKLAELLDEPFFVHQSTKVDEVLPIMSKNRQNIAIVTDNYGGTLGLVTIEDMVEELVGEIWDEEDTVEEPVTLLEGGELSVDADLHVEDLFDEMDFEDPENNDELTDKVLGAWAFESFGGIPAEGDSFDYHGLRVTVSKMNGNRITRLKVRREQ